jgi:predicted nucleic acid-binding protein
LEQELIFDTNILVDLIREANPAFLYMQKISGKPFVSALTVAELYSGVHNQREKSKAEKLIRFFTVLPVTAELAAHGGYLRSLYYKSHGMDVVDAVIAATAELHSLQLVTMNTKHFPMFPDLKRPYEY